MSFVEVFDAVRRANGRCRGLVSHYGLDPVFASRVYFLNGVARALVLHDRLHADGAESAQLVGLANLLVLAEHFPGDPVLAAELRRAEADGRRHAGPLQQVRLLIAARRGDGAMRNPSAAPPDGELAWRSLEHRPPVRPGWGGVTPFGPPLDERPCDPPPTAGSDEHAAQLAAVREAATGLTHSQLAQVLRWACSIGSESPAGQWQAILEEELASRWPLEPALHALTLAEIALFDAGIACWRLKYEHWYPRPSNLDAAIPLHIHLPNFPSYTSGHSSFSFSVVGAVGAVRPELSARLEALAEEAAWSRVLAGVHYPCDCDGGKQTGLAVGRRIAAAFPDLGSIAARA